MPSTHGHAMTSTVIERRRAASIPAPVARRTAPVTNEIVRTAGINTREMLSAIRSNSDLLDKARSTILMMDDSVVLSPMRCASISRMPLTFIDDATTVLPTPFSIGFDSPVSNDSSTTALPSTITPSAGIFSPAFTMNLSLTFSFSIETSRSPSGALMRTFFGSI